MNMIEPDWRELTPREREVILRLIDSLFVENEQLREQVSSAQARMVDREGSLALKVDSSVPVQHNARKLPRDGYYKDEDGERVDLILHVRDGTLKELELVKPDLSPVARLPEAGDIIIY